MFSLLKSILFSKLIDEMHVSDNKIKTVTKYTLKNGAKLILVGGGVLIVLNQIFDLGIDTHQVIKQIKDLYLIIEGGTLSF